MSRLLIVVVCMYATVCALVSVYKEAKMIELHDYFANALDYIEKFPTPEFGIFFVKIACWSKT